MADKPKFDTFVQLTGNDSNMGAIMGSVARALRAAGADTEQVTEFRRQIFAAESYDHALRICGDWVEIG